MKSKNNGFTLVELIVVIVILAILIGVSISGIYKWVNKARQNTDINNCKAIENALNEGLVGEKFPATGIAYANCFVMDSVKNVNEGNMFMHSYVLGADGSEGAVQNNTSGVTLSNGKFADKSIFSNRIKKNLALEDWGSVDGTASLVNSKTSYYYIGIVYVDEQGNFIKAKCVIYDYKKSDYNYYIASRGLVALYCSDIFNPDNAVPVAGDNKKWVYNSDRINHAKEYLIYDGVINKFED